MRLVAVLLTLWAGSALGEPSEPPRPRFNPFARLSPDAPPAAPGPVLDELSRIPAAFASSFGPQLRATLAAGSDSLVNLDGRILRIGEEAFGYQLVRVWEWGAEFERDGRAVVLELDLVKAAVEEE